MDPCSTIYDILRILLQLINNLISVHYLSDGCNYEKLPRAHNLFVDLLNRRPIKYSAKCMYQR